MKFDNLSSNCGAVARFQFFVNYSKDSYFRNFRIKFWLEFEKLIAQRSNYTMEIGLLAKVFPMYLSSLRK